MSRWVRWFGLLLFPVFAASACADSGLVVTDGSGIVIEYVSTVPANEATGFYGPRVRAFDSRGRMIVAGSDMNDGVPFVTTLAGQVIRTLGRRGKGPGEFSEVNAIFVDALDSTFVFDRGTGRMTVFGPDLEYSRAFPVDTRAGGTGHRFSNGNWLIASTRFNGPPFLLIAADGELLSAWGDSVDYIEPANGMSHRFHWEVGPGLNDVAWAARRSGHFEILGFDSDGREVARLTPESDWFIPYESPRMPSEDSPPQAALRGVWEDESGLWIVGFTADERWRNALGDAYRVEGRTANRVTDRVRYLDMVVELRNPVTGELRASRREDQVLLPSQAGARDLLMDLTRDDLGFSGFELYRLRYVEPE